MSPDPSEASSDVSSSSHDPATSLSVFTVAISSLSSTLRFLIRFHRNNRIKLKKAFTGSIFIRTVNIIVAKIRLSWFISYENEIILINLPNTDHPMKKFSLTIFYSAA